VCFDAFAQLLALPDSWDLPRRAHVYRYEGDPDRQATRLPWQRQERRVNPGLRVLGPTGTG
jgi:hypothetical protein